MTETTTVENSNNNQISIKNVRVNDIFSANDVVAIPLPNGTIKINLGGTEEEIEYFKFKSTDNLRAGDIIDIENIDLNGFGNNGNQVTNKGWIIDENFNKITIKKKVNEKQANQEKIISWINDGFNLVFDNNRQITGGEYFNIVIPTGSDYIESFFSIFAAIKKYIHEHPEEFSLTTGEDEGTKGLYTEKYQTDSSGNPLNRPWWSPIINFNESSRMCVTLNADSSGQGFRMVTIAGTRAIKHRNGGYILPGALEEQQYEELKNLIPGVCQVRGCCNNYPDNPSDISNNISGVTVIDGKCGHHRREGQGFQPNNYNNNGADNIFEIISRAKSAYDSNDLQQLKQSIRELESAKASQRQLFNTYDGENWLNRLINKELGLEVNQGNESLGAGNNDEENPESTTPPTNNANSSLQTAKNNAIQEISNTLNQESKISNSDLAENNRGWKEQINIADNENEIINIKNRVMADISAKRKAKKEAENIVNNLQTEGKDAEQLKKQLEEVEKSKGQQSYEDNQSGIDNLKDELAKKVSGEEYCQIMARNAEKTMAKYNIKADELNPEIKKDWEKLKNGEIKEKGQVDEIEKKVAKEVGEKGSKKKLNHILQEAQEFLKLGGKDKIKAVKNKLYNFLASTDIYEKALLTQKGKEIKKMLKDLENYSSQKQTNSPDKFPWRVVIPVALVLLTLIIILGIIIYRQRKKRLKL